MTPTWYGMELVSCHAGQTLLGGIALGWILAWLTFGLWQSLLRLGDEAEQIAAEERDDEPVSGSRSVSSSGTVSNAPDPIESYPTHFERREPIPFEQAIANARQRVAERKLS